MMELKTFAVAVYSEPGVSEACLALQDQRSIDVPLLLFCGWHGAYHGRLSPAHLTQAIEISQQLSTHLVRPLRQARRWMKTRTLTTDSTLSGLAQSEDHERSWNMLREQIKNIELKAELMLLDSLASNLISAGASTQSDQAPLPHTLTDIEYNLNLLAGSETQADRGSGAAPGTEQALLTLIAAACLDTARGK